MSAVATMPDQSSDQERLYHEAADMYCAALERLAHAYEADPESRRDLVQEIHIALWRSFKGFERQCSLRTWIYRVAHNVSATHVMRQRRSKSKLLVGLEELENMPDSNENRDAADRHQALERLLRLIQALKPLDKQVILSYLEGLDAASIAEITGLSVGNVATKVHRIKHILARRFHAGEQK